MGTPIAQPFDKTRQADALTTGMVEQKPTNQGTNPLKRRRADADPLTLTAKQMSHEDVEIEMTVGNRVVPAE